MWRSLRVDNSNQVWIQGGFSAVAAPAASRASGRRAVFCKRPQLADPKDRPMIAYRLLAPSTICRSAFVVIALGWNAANPAAEAAFADGWQVANSSNPYREEPTDWAPSRNQLRETAPQTAKASSPSTDATARQLQRPGEPAANENTASAK